MKGSRLILLIILSAALSAGLTSWLAKRWLQEPGPPSPTIPHAQSSAPSDQDFHRWLHANLELTPAQEEALRPAEARFEAEHQRLLHELQTTSTSLAHALSKSGTPPEEFTSLMAKRHELQGQIQRLVIAHLLEKRAQLTPGQEERFRDWIHQSITHDHGK